MTKGDRVLCRSCGGTGKQQTRDVNTGKLVTVKCPSCNGTGKRPRTFMDAIEESLDNYGKNPH